MPKQKLPETWESDVRRGLLRLLVLAVIKESKSTFGYAIAQSIRERTTDRLIVQDGTLYPLLRRLEEQKLVRSTWDVSGERPRKYYQLTAAGDKQLLAMLEFWNELVISLDPLFRGIVEGRVADSDYQEQVQFCTSCGNQVYPGAIYCANCGAEISESE
ncbi:MAG: helix-turn-helix transcriptional regulator [Candidatus Hermodarchaeota archaeon]|nr:helix-turn-helix transcriptional regulator [Candidatus Hermodarchaeota archaeon]